MTTTASPSVVKRVFLLTGRPGTGKTSIIRHAVTTAGRSSGGFYTGEIRSGARRVGFRITTLDGQDALLAHVDFPGPYRVGKYGVSIDNLDRVGVAAVRDALRSCDLIIIDEIGKMELLSQQFQQAVLQALDSSKRVLGSLLGSPHPFADPIRGRPDVMLRTVTESNRSAVLAQVLRWLGAS